MSILNVIAKEVLAEFRAIKDILSDSRDILEDLYIVQAQTNMLDVSHVPRARDMNYVPQPGEVKQALLDTNDIKTSVDELIKESEEFDATSEEGENNLASVTEED